MSFALFNTSLEQGDFKWMHRSRIRTTLLGSNGKIPESTDLFRHTTVKMEQVNTSPELLDKKMANKYKAKMKRVLPYLALNEVCQAKKQSSMKRNRYSILSHNRFSLVSISRLESHTCSSFWTIRMW